MTFKYDSFTTFLFTILIGIGGLILILLISNALLPRILKKLTLYSSKNIRTEKDINDYNLVKRIMDILISFLMLFFIFPTLLIISVFLLITAKKVFQFRRRVGKNGKEFDAIFFATIRQERLPSGQIKSSLTPLGSFLEKTMLYLLPNLINVLKGEMSMVGRSVYTSTPQTLREISQKDRKVLLNLKPGMFSLSSINFENVDKEIKTLVNLDLYYAGQMSLKFDLKIIVLMIVATLGFVTHFDFPDKRMPKNIETERLTNQTN